MFAAELVTIAIVMAITWLWARRSALDLGLRAPAMAGVTPWLALFVFRCAAEQAFAVAHPIDVDPAWLAAQQEFSLLEDLILSGALGPLCEELFYRGAMFSALLRRWGIRTAVVVPSLLWGLSHLQYEWWYIGWKSGSIYLPLGLHAAFNISILIPSALAAGRAGVGYGTECLS